jgi:hypothetical protein
VGTMSATGRRANRLRQDTATLCRVTTDADE